MKYHQYKFPVLAGLKTKLKRQIRQDKLDLPCRVQVTVERLLFGKHPSKYVFDFLIEETPRGIVAHEIDHWIEEIENQKLDKEIVLGFLKDVPTETIAEILTERIKSNTA